MRAILLSSASGAAGGWGAAGPPRMAESGAPAEGTPANNSRAGVGGGPPGHVSRGQGCRGAAGRRSSTGRCTRVHSRGCARMREALPYITSFLRNQLQGAKEVLFPFLKDDICTDSNIFLVLMATILREGGAGFSPPHAVLFILDISHLLCALALGWLPHPSYLLRYLT